MTPRIENAEYVGDYTIRITFSDGRCGDVDLENELWGEVFEPLKDKNTFKQFQVHPELHTVVWPNGADLAPEFLYQHAST